MEKQDYSINVISMIFQNMDKCGLRLTKPELDLCEECTNGSLCKLLYNPCPAKLVYTKLSQYEDTGLTPEEVQQMQWIPVEERLPEEEGAYIVCVDGEVKWDAYCRFGRKERWLCYDGRLNALYIDPYSSKPKREPPYPRVTHWMHLPKAPKEENKDD